jgi:pilus assembly protein Flp/PilA
MKGILMRFFRERGADDKGASAVEYALIVALIAVVAIVGITAFGEDLGAFFEGLSEQLGLE